MRSQNTARSGLILCLAMLMAAEMAGCASQRYTPSSGYDNVYRRSSDNFDDDFAASGLPPFHGQPAWSNSFDQSRYAMSLPGRYDTDGEKMILVDPNRHAWGAYDREGNLVRAGMATAGAERCPEEGNMPCRTDAGTFRIFSMGDAGCYSKQYPVGEGGALMPFCMFFHNGQSLHGSPDQIMSPNNISHGCVHMRIPDAEWLRYNFAQIGTKVKVVAY